MKEKYRNLIIVIMVLLFITSISCIDNGEFQKFDDIEKYQAYPGIFLGARLGCDIEGTSCENISEFNQRTGKPHAIFSRYIDIGDSRSPSHWKWAEDVKRNGAMPMFVYDPMNGLDNIDISNVEYFAKKSRRLNITVFIVFGHEMNLKSFPWGNQPDKFKEKFKLVADIFHRLAPNVKMVWLPNQNWGYPWKGIGYGDGYSEYYPDGTSIYGEYVDWVGINFYDRDWDENNLITPRFFVSNIKNGKDGTDFYNMFAVAKNKSMLIGETGSFDSNKDPTTLGERNPLDEEEQARYKNEWIKQVYNVSTLKEFPMLDAIIYFNMNKFETIFTRSHKFSDISTDYSIPRFPNVYGDLISNDYFIGSRNVSEVDINGDGQIDIMSKICSWSKYIPIDLADLGSICH